MPRLSALSDPLPLLLLTRPGCGLCEEFAQELHTLGREIPLPPVRLVDVDSDAQLARRHGLEVPVLLWGGVKICEHRLDRAELTRLLRQR